MNFFITSFTTRLKSTIGISFLVASLLIPIITISLGTIFTNNTLSIQIGIYGDLKIHNENWTITQYTNKETMLNDVANRRLELAYALKENKIILYTSPATVTDRVTNLLISASHLETIAGEIGANILSHHFEHGVDAKQIQNRVDAILADGPLMESITIFYGEGVTHDFIPFRRLFHGMFALFGQLLAMLCAMGFANKNDATILHRLKSAGTNRLVLYQLSGLAVVFVLTSLVMFGVALTGSFIFTGVWRFTTDALPAFVYLLMVSSIAMLMATKLPQGAYPAAIVLTFIFTALMGGVVFDLREVLESVALLRFLFPSHYYISQVL